MSFRPDTRITFLVLVFMGGLALVMTCPTVHLNKKVGGPNKDYATHEAAGLTRQCLESTPELRVSENEMRCFKWRVKKTGDVVLRDRPAKDQELFTATSDSVLFRSFGFNNSRPHYMNNMFCLYNVTIPNCDSMTAQSVPGKYSLYPTPDDSVQDYLYLNYGGINDWSTLYGNQVANYSTSIPTSSFYAILWTDSTQGTSAGAFALIAVCNKVVDRQK